MQIKPDKKLITKSLYVLLTISLIILLAGILLQILVPLGKPTASEVAVILWPIIAGIIFLLWIISVPVINLWIKNLSYEISEDRVIIYKGILSKIQQNIPFRAITDFMLHRSLYDRFLGIGSIRIQTAGQSTTPTGYEGTLSGLIDYNDLLKELQNRLKDVKQHISPNTVSNNSSHVSEGDIRLAILQELKEIRKVLEMKE